MDFPVVIGEDAARRDPHLALLTALMHVRSERGPELALTAFHGLAVLDAHFSPLAPPGRT